MSTSNSNSSSFYRITQYKNPTTNSLSLKHLTLPFIENTYLDIPSTTNPFICPNCKHIPYINAAPPSSLIHLLSFTCINCSHSFTTTSLQLFGIQPKKPTQTLSQYKELCYYYLHYWQTQVSASSFYSTYITTESQMCDKHKDALLLFFCKDCNVRCCSYCKNKHDNHNNIITNTLLSNNKVDYVIQSAPFIIENYICEYFDYVIKKNCLHNNEELDHAFLEFYMHNALCFVLYEAYYNIAMINGDTESVHYTAMVNVNEIGKLKELKLIGDITNNNSNNSNTSHITAEKLIAFFKSYCLFLNDVTNDNEDNVKKKYNELIRYYDNEGYNDYAKEPSWFSEQSAPSSSSSSTTTIKHEGHISTILDKLKFDIVNKIYTIPSKTNDKSIFKNKDIFFIPFYFRYFFERLFTDELEKNYFLCPDCNEIPFMKLSDNTCTAIEFICYNCDGNEWSLNINKLFACELPEEIHDEFISLNDFIYDCTERIQLLFTEFAVNKWFDLLSTKEYVNSLFKGKIYNRCASHPSKANELFCNVCHINICNECASSSSHAQHEFVQLNMFNMNDARVDKDIALLPFLHYNYMHVYHVNLIYEVQQKVEAFEHDQFSEDRKEFMNGLNKMYRNKTNVFLLLLVKLLYMVYKLENEKCLDYVVLSNMKNFSNLNAKVYNAKKSNNLREVYENIGEYLRKSAVLSLEEDNDRFLNTYNEICKFKFQYGRFKMRIVQTQNMSEEAIIHNKPNTNTKINSNVNSTNSVKSVNSSNSNDNKSNTITSNNNVNVSNNDTSSHISNYPSRQTTSTTDTYHPPSLPKELLEEIDELTTYDNETIQSKFQCNELLTRIFSHKTPPISHMISLNYGEHDKNEHWNLFTVARDGTMKILSKKDLKSKVKLKSQHKAPITHSCVLGDNFIFTSSEDSTIKKWKLKSRNVKVKFIRNAITTPCKCKDTLTLEPLSPIIQIHQLVNNIFISISENKCIRIWENEKKKVTCKLTKPEEGNKFIAVYAISENEFCVATEDNSIYFYKVSNLFDSKKKVEADSYKVLYDVNCYTKNDIVKLRDNAMIVGGKEELVVLNLETWKIKYRVKDEGIRNIAAVLALSSEVFVIACEKELLVFKLYKDFKLSLIKKVKHSHVKQITGMALVDGNQFFTCSMDSIIAKWEFTKC